MILLRTLGTASIEIEGTAIVTPFRARQFPVLLYLAVEHGREASRERLTSLAFCDQSPVDAAHSLREVIYQLRRSGVTIVGTVRGFTIPSEHVNADYEMAVHDGAPGDAALRAMAAGFLPAFTPPKSEAYAEWLDGVRASKTVGLVRRLLPELENALHTARWPHAERLAQACLGLDPLNERATFAMAEIRAVSGSKAAAFELLDGYTRDVGPGSEDLATRVALFRRRISGGRTSRHPATEEPEGDTHPMPRLVGRTAEFAAFLDAFSRVKAGEPQCVVVAGEPGIGKTRLVNDFCTSPVAGSALVERVTCQPHDGSRPMGAFVDLVPALMDANGALGSSPASLAALKNLIGQRADGDVEQPASGAEEHEQRWTAVSRAVVDLCGALASEQTLLLVIEDAHWLDALSANTIGRIVGTRRKAKIMVVVTTRDPRPLLREIRLTEGCRTLTLPPLGPDAANELLDIVLPAPARRVREGAGGHARAIRERIAESAAGNPLFLITLAAHSRAHRGRFEVPGTLVEMFAQRIDRLTPQSMIVLATCAELGKHSTLRRLARALELRTHQLTESLLELSDSGLILRDTTSVIPAHPLVSDAMRTRLPDAGRCAVSHAVAKTLEEDAQGGASSALWWGVAQSWRTSRNPERTINALRQCARHALEIGRPGEAATILNEAAHHPQTDASLRVLSEELIRSANAANDCRLVLHGAALRRRSGYINSHDELELAELRAALRADLSADAVERLVACVKNGDASSSHRVEAGLALLKASDTMGSGELRDLVTANLTEADLALVPLLKRLEFTLLVNVTARDWTNATRIAKAILGECGTVLGNAGCAHNAAIALLYSGHVGDAIAGFQISYELGSKVGSPQNQLTGAVMLAQLSFEFGNEAEYKAWSAVCQQLVQEAPHVAGDFDFVVGRALAALYSNDIDGVQTAMSEAEVFDLFSPPIRSRWKRALELGFHVLQRPPTAADEEVARQIVAEPLNTLNGVRDLEIGLGCQVLAERGLKPLASRVLLEFLDGERGHLAPLSPAIVRALAAVGMSGDPTGSGRSATSGFALDVPARKSGQQPATLNAPRAKAPTHPKLSKPAASTSID